MMFVPIQEDYLNANSYITLERAEELIGGSAWESLSEDEKKLVLVKATLVLDGAYAYKGEKVSEEQPLQYPKVDNEMPTRMELAVALQAEEILNNVDFRKTIKEKIDKLEWWFDTSGVTLSQKVDMYLKPLKIRTVRLECANK